MEDAIMVGAGTDTGADRTDIEGAGGEPMVIPYLVAGLGSLYTVGKAYDSIRYWSDYKKNTGYSPRYPFKNGSMDWVKYGAGAGYSFSRLKRL